MQRRIGLCGFILIGSCWLTIPAMDGQGASQGLKPNEYDGVALIYNQEISALGNRALFPICIGMPSGMPTEPLVRYLRKGGFEISDEAVCQPAMAPGGQHHPKDYSHGLRIFIDKLQRDSAGVISMHVQADDLTVRPGEHFAQTLRRGTYQLKQDQAGKWQITNYTKEYDSEDEKGQHKCNCAQASTAMTQRRQRKPGLLLEHSVAVYGPASGVENTENTGTGGTIPAGRHSPLSSRNDTA